MKKVNAYRVNNLHVMTRIDGGAPRPFLAKPGTYTQKYTCVCPKGGRGCSHEQALYALLHEEAAAMSAVPSTVVPHVVA